MIVFNLSNMTTSEMKRDALLAFYLKYIVPNTEPPLERPLATPEDLYEYLLIDPEISSAVMTSPVASAIASLQTFVSNVSLNMEPGLGLTSEQTQAWKQVYHQYPIWGANQLLSIYPENYIDPTLRLSRTTLFKSLETALNQAQLTEDVIETAIFTYLNEFEKTSNLHVVSGYQDGDDINQSTFYFVGRTRIQPYEYYWRKLDMRQREPESHIIYPTAWSAWKKIELPIVDAVKAIVRPIFFKGRLFVIWLELRDEKDPNASTKEETKAITKLHLKLGFKRFDDSWSPSQDFTVPDDAKTSQKATKAEQKSITAEEIEHLLVTATQFSRSSIMFVGIYGKEDDTAFPTFYSIDELLSLTKEETEIFKDYPFDAETNGKIPIAMPILHADYGVTPPASQTGAPLFPGSSWGEMPAFTVDARVFEVSEGSSEQPKKTVLSVDVSYVIFQLFCVMLSPDTPECINAGLEVVADPVTDHILNNKDKDIYNLKYYLDEDNGKQILAQGLKLTCTNKWNGEGTPAYPIVTHEFTITLFERPTSYKDSTAYIQIDKAERQLLNFAEEDALTPIRLNTLFAKKLISLASVSIADLLHLYSQYERPEHPENPEVAEEQAENNADVGQSDLDFYGANGLYFWELFFHMPFLVAYSLNRQQRFEQASEWFHYLFDPLKGANFCWGVRILLREFSPEGQIGMRLIAPTDPDNIASTHPIHYRKAIFRRYVSNLIDHGDALYRELTPDSLTEAKTYYITALDLLGPRPDSSVNDYWQPITLVDASKVKNQRLLAYEKQFLEKMSAVGMQYDIDYRSAVQFDATITTLSNGLFLKPINKELLACWDSLANRLFNLRHNLTIDGKPLHLPLFAPVLEPGALQRNPGQGLNNSAGLGPLQIPYYRFSVLINKAQNAVDSLIQFGNTLTSIFERRDNRQWETLQNEQQKALLEFTLSMQNESIDLVKANNAALLISQTAAEKRYDYYKKLYDDNVSNNENDALNLLYAAAASYYAATPLMVIAGAVGLAPNIFGLADGGSRWQGPPEATAGGLLNLGFGNSTTAQSLQANAEYQRRREDWGMQRDLASYDKDLIQQQITIGDKQLSASQSQLAQIKKQQSQIQDSLNFFSTRFTNQALYQWMIGQLSALYFQAYDAVTSLCLATEAAWQYEIGDFKTRFIMPGAWNDLYHGFLAGETLKLYLQRMDQQYLHRYERKLEITKTISLKKLVGDEKFNTFKTEGKLSFDLKETDYSVDYPGQYLRQITAVSISLPAVLGPYQDVKAILTQTTNAILVVPNEDAFKSLWNRKPKSNDSALRLDLRARQQISLSTGIDDSGLFVLNFGDDRYLPFEGTGAVSSWELVFPNATSAEQKAILDSLTDVIMKVRYTAKASTDPEFNTFVDDLVKAETEKRNKARTPVKQKAAKGKAKEKTSFF